MENSIRIVLEAIDYIEAHLKEKMDLGSIAEAVHYSKYHLHRMFKDTVGLTIHEYAKRRQLTEAANLLVFSNKSILEVAFIAGYESQQAFTSVFKSLYKMSPNQYRERGQSYPLQLRFFLQKKPLMYDQNNDALQQCIKEAVETDIPLWMDLVRLAIDGYPYLEEEDYQVKLRQHMAEKSAYIIKSAGIAVGSMLFREKYGSIDFLGIHPQYRRQGIAKAFVSKIIHELIATDEITVTTFREGDKADTGQRKLYEKLGFIPAELLTEFGYPTQRFVLQLHSQEHLSVGRI